MRTEHNARPAEVFNRDRRATRRTREAQQAVAQTKAHLKVAGMRGSYEQHDLRYGTFFLKTVDPEATNSNAHVRV